MNTNHIKQVFQNYIENFELTNNQEHKEYVKWIVTGKFHRLMDEALSKSGAEFAEALKEVKANTWIMIDNGMIQPFNGLVEFAKQEPDTVRQMFIDLYSDYGGGLHVLERKISEFAAKSNELLEEYKPGSFRYKQDFHAVMGYLFLYEPDVHYMYKSTEARAFADCIEFYDDWDYGFNVKLDVYYRMCNWAIEQINDCPELLATNQSRYELPDGAAFAPDESKHLLLFDIIYCYNTYDLDKGIEYSRLNTADKKLRIERQNKAKELWLEYEKVVEKEQKLCEKLDFVKSHLTEGTVLYYKVGIGYLAKYQRRTVKSCDNECMIEVTDDTGNISKLNAPHIFSSKLAKTDDGILESLAETEEDYWKDLCEPQKVYSRVKNAEEALEPYREYL
ncbi:MAG: hypothetical protein LUH56_00645 [Oscillospiraceae bacterium]|nr:hypothetical protein [Oscillospiraceae bacterium]